MELRDVSGDLRAALKHRGLVGTVWRCLMEPLYLIQDRMFDRRFRVTTANEQAAADLDSTDSDRQHSHGYMPVRPHAFKEVIRALDIDYERFVFVDFGSGLGRAVLLASEFPFKKVIGVELSPQLNRIAAENLRTYASATQKSTHVTVVCDNATRFAMPPEPTVFYFFNPFDAAVMEKVLTNMQTSLQQSPRQVFVVLYNPTLEHVVRSKPFLTNVTAAARYSIYTNTGAHHSGASAAHAGV